ncbi:hypothetical protein MTO96_000866 [Rhipicephalus appendiculatus]
MRLQEDQSTALSEISEERHRSHIGEFYQDRAVFVTGATGFIGKVFDRLKREQPDALGKVKAVQGDLTEPNLGLSEADLATLIENVSIVFHAAATVKFDEPLKEAFQINVLGTRQVLDICKRMRKFCVLVHVSTAYCNCDKLEVLENVYPQPELPPEIIEHVQCTDSKMADSPSGLLPAHHPNTYTFTKSLAESVLLEERANLPVSIVRPSIVTASWKEPFPITDSRLLHYLNLFFLHYLPACAGDLILMAMGRKSSFVPTYHKIQKSVAAVERFTCSSWHFKTDNLQELLRDLPPTDKLLFSFDVRGLQWKVYWDQYMLGIRRYLFKAEDSELPRARRWFKTSLGEKIASKLQFGQPNNYVLTKSVTESLLLDQQKELPLAIVRPSIVSASWREPCPLFDLDVRKLDWSQYWDNYMLGIRKYLFNVNDPALPQERDNV